jgi:amino acid transporter
MGRDGIISKKFFGHLDRKYATPNYNILLIGGITLVSTLFFNYEECARLINFGAFFAFMAVNIASIREYYFNEQDKSVRSFMVNFLPAFIGFCICLFIWLNLPLKTFVIGGAWMIIGIIYLSIRTKGFTQQTPVISFS